MTKLVRQWRKEMEDYVKQFGGYPATGEGERFDIEKIGANGLKAYCQVADERNRELNMGRTLEH